MKKGKKEFIEQCTAWKRWLGASSLPVSQGENKGGWKVEKRERSIAHAVWNQGGELIANVPRFILDSKGEIMCSKNIQNYNSCFLKEVCGTKKGKTTARQNLLLSGLSWFLKVQETIRKCKIISHLQGFWKLFQNSQCCPASERMCWNTWMPHSTYWKAASEQKGQGKQEVFFNMSLEACWVLQYKQYFIKLQSLSSLACTPMLLSLHWELPVWNSLWSMRSIWQLNMPGKACTQLHMTKQSHHRQQLRTVSKMEADPFQPVLPSQRQRHCQIPLNGEALYNQRHHLRSMQG